MIFLLSALVTVIIAYEFVHIRKTEEFLMNNFLFWFALFFVFEFLSRPIRFVYRTIRCKFSSDGHFSKGC